MNDAILIETKRENGQVQWWQVLYDKRYIYLEYFTHLSQFEDALDNCLNTIKYSDIRLVPIISPDPALDNYDNWRGTASDKDPFIIRGRVIGTIHFTLRQEYGEVKPSINGYMTKRSHYDKWNFTEKQREALTKWYKPQLLEFVNKEGFADMIKKRHTRLTVQHLLKQIKEHEEKLAGIKKIAESEKYKV